MPCPSPSLAIVASMGFDNGSGDGQSQAGAACPATARAVGAVEAAEDVGKVCGVGADLSERSDRARHGRLSSRFSAGLGAFSAGLALFTPGAAFISTAVRAAAFLPGNALTLCDIFRVEPSPVRIRRSSTGRRSGEQNPPQPSRQGTFFIVSFPCRRPS